MGRLGCLCFRWRWGRLVCNTLQSSILALLYGCFDEWSASAKPAVATHTDSWYQAMQTHRAEVLVVDDAAAMRQTLRLTLDYAGYTVYEAPDGRPALERLQAHPQGMVVLLNLNMPGMDGVALLRALATDPDLAIRHRIIILSAQPSHMLPLPDAQLIAQHTIAFVSKPFDLEALLDVVVDAGESLSS